MEHGLLLLLRLLLHACFSFSFLCFVKRPTFSSVPIILLPAFPSAIVGAGAS